MHRPGNVRPSTLALLAIALSIISACVGSRGEVRVGQPQVHIRERLVSERQSRMEWLRREREASERIGPSVQGMRDLREFTGVYNELKASVDAGQASLNRAELRNEKLLLDGERWRRERDALQARREFERLRDGPPSGDQDPPFQARDGDGVRSPALPATSVPFSTDQSLPSPEDIASSNAEAHPLDVFRDRLALRNAIEAEIRQSQFDDGHDVRGGALYGLTLDLTVVPGDWSEEFVEVELEVHRGPIEERLSQVQGLYGPWMDQLASVLRTDIWGQLPEQRDTYELDWVRWYAEVELPNLIAELRHEEGRITNGKTDRKKAPGAGGNAPQRLSDAACIRLFDATHDPRWLSPTSSGLADGALRQAQAERSSVTSLLLAELTRLEDLQARVRSHGDRLWKESRRTPVQQTQRDLATQAIVGSYQRALGGLARIDIQLDRVTVLAPVHTFACLDPGGLHLGTDLEDSSCPHFEEFLAAGSQRVRDHLLLGEREFSRRLLRAERAGVQAYAVSPKELAQNISDVSARESVISMISAIQAMLPAEGVSAEDQFQFLQRSQERLHAILRQPLVVGFSRGAPVAEPPASGGKAGLGWVLGPKFRIVDGEASFVHSPTRYDVSAEVTAPAWLDSLRIRGRYHWIHERGGHAGGELLWDGRDIEVPLPRPESLFRHITKAVCDEFALESDSMLWYARRPAPVVHSVQPSTLLSGKGRSLVIRGENLWRSPEVFVGGQRADRVEVLSSMNGLAAYFDDLAYPGLPPRSLENQPGIDALVTVVTSFGEADRRRVRVFADPSSQRRSIPGSSGLETHFLVAGSRETARFRYDRPAAYHALAVRLTDAAGNSQDVEGTPAWSADSKSVTLNVPNANWPGSGDARLVKAWLLQRNRADSRSYDTVPPEEGADLALFMSDAARSAEARAAAETIAFDGAGRIDPNGSDRDGLQLQIAESRLRVLQVAYPGLRSAMTEDRLVLRLQGTPSAAPAPALTAQAATGGLVPFVVTVPELEKHRAGLVLHTTTARPMLLEFTRGSGDQEVVEQIPVYFGTTVATLQCTESSVALTAQPSASEVVFPVRRSSEATNFFIEVPHSTSVLERQIGAGWRTGLALLPQESTDVLELEYLSTSGDVQRFRLEVPLARTEGILAELRQDSDYRVVHRPTGRPFTLANSPKIKFSSQEEATLTLASTRLTQPTSGSVAVVLTLAEEDERNLRHDLRGEALRLRLSLQGSVLHTIDESRVSVVARQIQVEFQLAGDAAIWNAVGDQGTAFDVQFDWPERNRAAATSPTTLTLVTSGAP